MMFKSKRTIAGVAVAVILFIGYVIHAAGGNAPAADDLEGWAFLILVFIAICVLAAIATYVIAHILFAASVTVREGDKDEKAVERIITSETTEDEMDERITLMSSHVGYGVVGVGFIVMLISIAFFGVSAAVALNLLLGVFFLSAVVGACFSVYLYEIGENGCGTERN